jgi:hypothetical protein
VPPDLLARCVWPDLAPPFDAALRDAVAFVLDTFDPLGVIATGTIIRGTAHASSDLDVCVVHDAPYRRRIQRVFRGVPAEIFVNPAHVIRGYFEEEHRDARPVTAHMLATGFVVYARDPVVGALREEASAWLARRHTPSGDEVVRARYAAATRLEDGADVTEVDPATAMMLLADAVTAMLEHLCRVRDGRLPRPKELLATVAAHDAEVARLATTFFTTADRGARLAAAHAIADRTIGARGFFEWDSGDDPVRPVIPATAGTNG